MSVLSFFGESLSDIVFARKEEKTELEENIDNWYAYLFNVVEKERKELFYKMLGNDGKIYPKDLISFRNKFSDALGWLWINVFLTGDKSLENNNVSFSTSFDKVVEFAEDKLDRENELKILDGLINKRNRLEKTKRNFEIFYDTGVNEKINELKDKRKNTITEYNNLVLRIKRLQVNKEQNADAINTFKTIALEKKYKIDFYTAKIKNIKISDEKLTETLKNFDNKLQELNNQIKQKKFDLQLTEVYTGGERNYDKRVKESLQSTKNKSDKPTSTRKKTGKTVTPEKLAEEAKKRNVNLEDAKRLKEITQRQRSDATGFINDTDFGRVYVQQRRDYIAKVYTNDTEKKNMLAVFDKMNEQYEAGNASPPIQKYFERKYMKKDSKTGRVTIGNLDLETEPPLTVNGVQLAGKRKSPNPQVKNDPLRELKLYEDVRKNVKKKNEDGTESILTNGSLKRIVETEVVAAYNMGRLHQMYTSDVKFVRWVNDVENRKSGKVCQICTIRAMGTSESLRKYVGKESLSGIYTIEDAFTNRQLAIPSHPFCLCQLRPINPEEEKVLIAAGVFDKAGQTATTAAIGAMGIEGVTNTQLAKEGTDRTGWWYGALAAGGTAVAIGAMMWYLRKSLTSKYAAKLMKTKGVETLEKVSEKGLTPIEIPDRKTLMSSLKLTDDIKLDPTEIKPQKYNKQELIAFPELGNKLPDFETLIRDEAKIGDDLLEVGIHKTVTTDLKNMYKDKGLPNGVLETTLNDNIVSVNNHINLLRETYTQSIGEKRDAFARLIAEEQRNLKTLEDMVGGINKRKVGVPNYRMDMRELNNLFQELDEVPYTVGDKTILLGDEPVKTKIKQGVVKVKERFGANGVVDTENNYMQEKLARLSQKETITRKEYDEVMSFLRKSQRDKSLAELALTNEDASYMSQLRYVYNDSPGNLSEELREVVEKDLRHSDLITQILTTTKTLRENTKTYAGKLREGSKVDGFITPKDLTRNDANIRIAAIESRRKIVPTIDAILNYMEETRTPKLDNYYVLNDFSNILKVGGIELKDFQSKSKREKVKFLQGVRSKLIDDARKIERAEFTRYQKKWAMFGSPR